MLQRKLYLCRLGSAGRTARWLHSSHRLKDNSDERILSLMRRAGFSDSKRVAGRTLLVGHIAYYEATTPAANLDTTRLDSPRAA
jgi:hypothetical protein